MDLENEREKEKEYWSERKKYIFQQREERDDRNKKRLFLDELTIRKKKKVRERNSNLLFLYTLQWNGA